MISYQSLLLSTSVINDAKQKHLGYKKSVRPIRSNIANRQARPKGLISAEAKKLLYQNIFNSLNDTQYYHKYDWLSHLAIFYNSL